MLINDYVAIKLHQARQNDPKYQSGIQRAVTEIIADYKDQIRRHIIILKPRK